MAVINFPKIVADRMLEHAEENYYQVDVEDLFQSCYDKTYQGLDVKHEHTYFYVAQTPEVMAAFEEIERNQSSLDECEIVDPREDSR